MLSQPYAFMGKHFFMFQKHFFMFSTREECYKASFFTYFGFKKAVSLLICNSREYLYIISSIIISSIIAGQNKIGAFLNWWSNVLSQAERLCYEHVWWRDHVSVGEGCRFGAGQCPPPSTLRLFHPSIQPSIAPSLPIWLYPSLCPLLLGLPPSWQLACWAADTYPGIRGFTDTIDQTSTSFSTEMNV